MELNVNIDPEQINKMVADAILKSAIGEALKLAIERVLKDLTKTYDNPMDIAIKNEMAKLIQKTIANDYSKVIEEKVKAAVAAQVTDVTLEKIISAGIRQVTY